jgi:hypothetical protein
MSNGSSLDPFRLLLGKQLPPKEHLEHEASNDAEIIRQMIRHEDDVINQRFTWLCQIQGFLFAALALAWKEPTADKLAQVLCLLGITVSVTSWLALRSARSAVAELLEWWDKNKHLTYAGPDVFCRRVGPSWREYLLPWNILPVLFCLAWLVVLTITIVGSLELVDASYSIVIIVQNQTIDAFDPIASGLLRGLIISFF